MQLELKNIGMIKEATLKIDGLTVIAGENDTGKSTVGKALLLINQGNVTSVLGKFEDIFYFKSPSIGSDSLISFNNNIANYKGEFKLSKEKALTTIFIDTPIITNFFDFFSILDTIQNDSEYHINIYPYLSRLI
ncbi:ABC transporter ATP-binding protein [hydrothermal vent metagenome]|uniref:ABC transporter ATP-binding protein n=1 Tax=hydrothermal vent metagenome TaxID=652676 RepID=A0A1W1EL52_9ZZZZ